VSGPVSWGSRVAFLAGVHPDRAALVVAHRDGSEQAVSWSELDRRSTQAAHRLKALGAGSGTMVVIALPNSPEHYYAALGAWKVGACALPISPAMPPAEREKMLALAGPTVLVDDREGFALAINGESLEPLPDVISHPGKAIGSGGSTGLPKIIVDPNPWARDPDGFGRTAYGMRPRQVQLVAGPLYHNSPFGLGHLGLFADHTLVVMERFDAHLAVDLIERHRVQWAFLVPTMMARIARLPELEPSRLRSLEAIMHTAAPCPPWVKRAWIDLIGPEKVFELFGAAEAVGSTMIRGDEWLAHPGSLGKPYFCEMKILDEEQKELPAGEVGEIFMRSTLPGPTYEYRGAQAKRTQDGFESVGDLGWVDADGYLYLADRRVDLIITGGANIYPAEVEAALSEHPAVADVAVTGIPHADLGKTAHAIVEIRAGHARPSPDELAAYCAARLARYKVPRSFEFIARLPRNEAGKIRRSQLAEERASAGRVGQDVRDANDESRPDLRLRAAIPPNRLGLTGVDHIALPVSDAERLGRFYVDVLGASVFYVSRLSPEAVAAGRKPYWMVHMGAQVIQFLPPVDGADLPRRDHPSMFPHYAFGCTARELDAASRRLAEAGVPFAGPMGHYAADATSIYFRDPEGNTLELCTWEPFGREVPMLTGPIAWHDMLYEWEPSAPATAES